MVQLFLLHLKALILSMGIPPFFFNTLLLHQWAYTCWDIAEISGRGLYNVCMNPTMMYGPPDSHTEKSAVEFTPCIPLGEKKRHHIDGLYFLANIPVDFRCQNSS